jgi:predicted alpha/beta superfamily hydrolase
MGSSLGGLAAFHVGWKHADKVRRIGAVSPSFWWNNEETKGLVAATSSPPPLRLWIDVGTDEGSDPQATLDEERAVAQLCPFAHYQEYPGASHDEASWAARLPDILAWLFP